MDAFILAAGAGKRLRPLTSTLPKPLISVGKYRLIELHLLRLQAQGFRRVIINLAHLGEQIRTYLGSGERYGVSISYSVEPEGALETAGGIVHALDLIRSAHFIVINGDVLTDYNFSQLTSKLPTQGGHLILVDNPSHHPQGDFSLADNQVTAYSESKTNLTYSGIGCFSKTMFNSLPTGRLPLGPVLRKAVKQKQLTGEHYRGRWHDIGTLERLEAARNDSQTQAWISSIKWPSNE